MKKILKECPLIVSVCLSAVILVCACFFNDKISHFFPRFLTPEKVEDIGENVEELFEPEESTADGDKENETPAEDDINLAEESAAEEVVTQSIPDALVETVTQDYFDDALFIGDSRTVGLYDYSGWDNATFYADIGLTIFDIFDKAVVGEGRNKTTIAEALQTNTFGKIYFMIGINEMGTGDLEGFIDTYSQVVNQIRQWQPQAIIVLQGIMHVSEEKSAEGKSINNPDIIERNKAIATLADNETIFYLDMNEVVCDEAGNLILDYTFDGVHLKAKYYELWTAYLLEHGIIKKN